MLNISTALGQGRESIVSWFDHGRAFKVHNVPSFVSDVLPLFFKQTKFKSFQRQLNLWGFLRIQDGTEKGAYYHRDFLRDKPDLVCLLKRQKSGRKCYPIPSLSADTNIKTESTTPTSTPTPTTSIPFKSTTIQHQEHEVPIASLSDRSIMQPTCRQVSVGSLQNSDAIFEKWNLPSTLFTIANEITKESTASMIPKKSMKIEQEIFPIVSPTLCISNGSVPITNRITTSSDESSPLKKDPKNVLSR